MLLSTSFGTNSGRIDALLNQLIDGKDFASGQIPVELFENKDSWLIKAYLPGLKKEDIHIKVKSANIVYITAVREKPDNLYLSELEYGEMSASIKLGSLSFVKSEHVKAEYKDGVLNLKVLKHPDCIPYTIEIE